MTHFDDVRKKARLKTGTVSLCLDGELLDEIERLEAQLELAPGPASLGDGSRREIAEAIAGAKERMRESIVEFHLRAQPARQWMTFVLTRPIRTKDEDEDVFQARMFPWMAEAVSRTCVEPAMTVEQVEELADLLHFGSWNELAGSCLSLNGDRLEVPNSEAVSAASRGSAPE